MLARVAPLDTSDPFIAMRFGMRWREVVLVRGQSVVMLRMIVVRIDVRMQLRPHACGGNQRRNEEQRQDALHTTSLWDNRKDVKTPHGPCGISKRLDGPQPTVPLLKLCRRLASR